MPRNRRPLAAALLAFAAALWTPAAAEPLSVTFMHVNDRDRMEGVDGRGGAAKIAAVVAEERARADREGRLALVTFGGDMISPSLLSGLDRGAHMIALANAIGCDFAVPGNHEFDFGPEVLKERLAQSKAESGGGFRDANFVFRRAAKRAMMPAAGQGVAASGRGPARVLRGMLRDAAPRRCAEIRKTGDRNP